MKYDSDPAFQKKWAASKANNKERLAKYIKATLGVTVDTKALFDVQVKRIHVSILFIGVRKAQS